MSECMMSNPMVRAREHITLTAVSGAMGLNCGEQWPVPRSLVTLPTSRSSRPGIPRPLGPLGGPRWIPYRGVVYPPTHTYSSFSERSASLVCHGACCRHHGELASTPIHVRYATGDIGYSVSIGFSRFSTAGGLETSAGPFLSAAFCCLAPSLSVKMLS